MHVDGFRFDVGSVLARGAGRRADGEPADHLGDRASEKLADTKLIAEAVGRRRPLPGRPLPGPRWAEWNGKFRDDVRRFVARRRRPRSATLATRIAGSVDLYEGSGQRAGRTASTSSPATTASRSTTSSPTTTSTTRPTARATATASTTTCSWNCGVEGATDDPERRGAPATGRSRTSPRSCFLSQGVPMFLAGDEIAPDAAGQQQRLLPGQRPQLVRLDARREERRPPPLLQAA